MEDQQPKLLSDNGSDASCALLVDLAKACNAANAMAGAVFRPTALAEYHYVGC
ncbi:hypothetical protein O9992_26240 [Vibrio lentus]|nr:hypothetical protein [Vibrio lentus]